MHRVRMLAMLAFAAMCVGIYGLFATMSYQLAGVLWYFLPAGWILSILAIVMGRAAQVRAREVWPYYALAILVAIVTGVAVVGYYFRALQHMLLRFGVCL
jgi:hypothetical protein